MEGLLTEQLCKSYPGRKKKNFPVLNHVSIHLEPGSFTSLVGESGCGKSTLARILTGLEAPDSGRILLDGKDATHWRQKDWRPQRRRLQAVFQDASGTLNPALSAYHNVEQALLNLTDLTRHQRRERIESLMSRTDMDPGLLKTPVRLLSGGEQRRLSLLRAISIRPAYLILDEVLSGLDLICADTVMSLLKQYHREYHGTVLLITHDMDSAYRLSGKIYRMQNGQIVREGINTNLKGNNEL